MRAFYADILKAIEEPPIWFDENAVPRFCHFGPDHLANIYAVECVLLRITCQCCRRPFLVALSWDGGWRTSSLSLSEKIRRFGGADCTGLDYGDPPNIACCPAGPTMNSVAREVIQFHSRVPPLKDWTRIQQHERDIVPDWWDDEDDEEQHVD